MAIGRVFRVFSTCGGSASITSDAALVTLEITAGGIGKGVVRLNMNQATLFAWQLALAVADARKRQLSVVKNG